MGFGHALLIVFQLGLAVWVIDLVQLAPTERVGSTSEGRLFSPLFALVPFFLVYFMVPLGWRLPLMLAGTAAVGVFALGPTATATLAAIGLALIGICHLPLPYLARVGLVVAVAGVLAATRAGAIDGGRHLMVALPILGAIFMFRLIIYLYDIRHEEPGTVTVWQRLGYFFLLPAPVFPFFPTLDYRTYLRSFYSRPAFEVAQVGVLWISRGVVHLVLYRIVYHFFSPPAEHVDDLGGVMAYCLAGYLIYLRVSGVFHLITGTLRLLGFDLPETHRLYFFASGFSDYWRRINIYWKDFMAKLFFFPSFAWLRWTGLSRTAKVALATAFVFVATTVLHSYQGFWLNGLFVFHPTDYWFWGILGALVIIDNLLAEKRRRKIPKKGFDARAAAWLSLRTAAMFAFLCVLWALWSSHEIGLWWGVMKQAANVEPWHFAVLAGFFAAAVALGTLGQWLKHRGLDPLPERPGLPRSLASTIIPLLVLGTVWQYQRDVGLRGELGAAADLVASRQPNLRDQIQKEKSYYQGLLSHGADSHGGPTLKVPAGDIRELLYRPGLWADDIFGATWSANSWGMRDVWYSKHKTPGVYRIAIGGASYTLGRGVDEGKNFESVLEAHLNEGGDTWIEILNFAQADTCTLQRMAQLEFAVLEFEPDAYYLFCHPGEADRNVSKLADLISRGVELTYPYLKELAAELGVGEGDDVNDITRKLRPHSDDLMRFAYTRMAELCAANDIRPVWVFYPLLRTDGTLELAASHSQIPRAAGFDIIVLDDAYGGRDPDTIKVSEHDYHPDETGHRLVARRLLQRMREQHEQLGLPERIRSAPDVKP